MKYLAANRGLAISLAILGMGLTAFPGVADAAESDSTAQEILSAVTEHLAGQSSFAIEAVVVYKGKVNGDVERLDTRYSIAFKRPAGIMVHAVNSEMEIVFVSDGKEYVRYVPDFGQYMSEPAEMSPAELITTSGFDIIIPALSLLGEMVRDEPYQEGIDSAMLSYIGEEEVDGVACNRIHYVNDAVSFDMWVERDGEPLVRRITPDMSALEKDLGANAGVTFEIDVSIEISKWDLGADVSKRVAFNAPEGVVKVAAFHAPSPAEQLKGLEAPDFTLALLDGGSLTLSEKMGKIVLLDFWATWCGPCRIIMPVLDAVSKEFADDGVELYGVNLREDPERVRAYLESKGLDLAVALDRDGRVGEMYSAFAIPQTVIVDRDGKVAVVHVGLWAMPTDPAEPGATEEDEMNRINDALSNALRTELRKLVSESTAATD